MPIFGDVDPKILADTYMVTNPLAIKVCQPMVPDKFPISQKAVNGVNDK